MFNKLCVIGVGLIGGSLARAARRQFPAMQISALGREQDLQNLELALSLGVIDSFSLNVAEALDGADCVVLATPVGAYSAVLHSLQPHWLSNVIYTDVGSTKANVLAACHEVFGHVPDNFVPGHPIAGAEQSGVAAALADLFYQKRIILTPLASTQAAAVSKLQAFWESFGAKVALMSVEQHDAILAATSHLPHILAFALVDMLGHKDEQSEIFKYAAGGFRDFSRIASSDPTMWLDICVANKQPISALLQELQLELDKIRQAIESDDKQALFDTFTYAKSARQRFLEQFNAGQ